MVQGIETDNKKYKHKKRNDEKWLTKDLQEFRKTTEKYIDSIRPNNEKQLYGQKQTNKSSMIIVRIITIILLGIFGSISLFTGIILIFKENYVLGIPISSIGAVFVISFILFEKFR